MTQSPLPWDRRPGESSTAYEAFSTYRDLGVDRSIVKAGHKLGKSTPTLERWSSQWQWVSRAAAWDDYLDKQAQKALEKEEIAARKAMKRRHRDMGLALQGIPMVWVNNKQKQIDTWRANGEDPKTCPVDESVKDVLAMWEAGTKSELRSYDEPSDITRVEETAPRSPNVFLLTRHTAKPAAKEENEAHNEPGLKD